MWRRCAPRETGGDGLLMFVLLKATTVAIGVVVLAVVGLPNAASIPYAIGSAAGFSAYCLERFIRSGAARGAMWVPGVPDGGQAPP